MFWRMVAIVLRAKLDRRRDLSQVVTHQGDIGGLEGHVGAGDAHRDPDRGAGQRGRVIDAVAYHRHRMLALQREDGIDLFIGQQTRPHVGNPGRLANAVRGPLVVAGEHHRDHAEPAQFGDGRLCLRPDGIGQRDDPINALGRTHDDRGLPSVDDFIDTLLDPGMIDGEHPHAADQDRFAIEQGAGAKSGDTLSLRRFRYLDSPGIRGRDDCPGERMGRLPVDGGCPGQHCVFRQITKGDDPHHRWPPGSQGAGLVERHGPHRRQRFDRRAALEKHSPARRGADRGDERHRRRDDQGAGASDHQQDQRPVDPIAAISGDQRPDRADQDGGGDHQRGVDRREPVDERLGRGARRLRLLNQVNDPGEGGVHGGCGGPDPQGAIAVDSPGEDVGIRLDGNRDRLPGDGRLIDT